MTHPQPGAQRLTMPSRTLLAGKRYTPAAHSDIRRTLAVFSRLARMQSRQQPTTTTTGAF